MPAVLLSADQNDMKMRDYEFRLKLGKGTIATWRIVYSWCILCFTSYILHYPEWNASVRELLMMARESSQALTIHSLALSKMEIEPSHPSES